ncbi:LysR substrate-binding domain-containing protein [Rhizobium sp. BK491]|uniref:LysR substrate-binding domain-containing protein n=1 Tax=Rhizobium sp. BK491 TaxID=2587009 RepID=UPI0032B1FB93
MRLSADNMQTLLSAALAGAGVVYGPAFVLGPHVATGNLELLLPDYTTESLAINAVYPSARLVSTKLRRFIALLEEWFRARRDWTASDCKRPNRLRSHHFPCGLKLMSSDLSSISRTRRAASSGLTQAS